MKHLYCCEICGTSYLSEQEANECEANCFKLGSRKEQVKADLQDVFEELNNQKRIIESQTALYQDLEKDFHKAILSACEEFHDLEIRIINGELDIKSSEDKCEEEPQENCEDKNIDTDRFSEISVDTKNIRIKDILNALFGV